MGSEWKSYKLGDLTSWSSGGTPSKSNEDYWNGNIPWISASSMDGSRYRESTLKITEEGLANGTRLAKKGSILLLVRGSILHQKIQVGIAEKDVAFNQDVKCLVPKVDDIDSWFLLYWFIANKNDLLSKVESTGIGAGKLDTKLMQELEVRVPPKHERLRITSFAKAIDDKIQLNRQTNQTLEQMAQALFKSWFVDFDPVIDNALLAGNKIPEPLRARAEMRQALLSAQKGVKERSQEEVSQQGSEESAKTGEQGAEQTLPAEQLRALFPSEFEHTDELGWVPKGWRVQTLDNVTTELRRGISPKYAEEKGVRVVNQKCIRHHEVNYSLCRLNDPTLRKIDGRELELGDVLVNSTGVGTLGRVAPVKYLDETTVVDSHVTVVRSDPDMYPKFVFAQLMIEKESEIEALGEGSTGQTELSRKILSEQTVLCPEIELLKSLDHYFEDLSDKSVSNAQQITELEKLRDTLLPKLISGELRLPDVESESADINSAEATV